MAEIDLTQPIESIDFIDTDPATIYTVMLTALEQQVGELLYPGDERRIFGEALVAAFVSLYTVLNDTARQTMLRYARGAVLDALGERMDTPRLLGDYASCTLRFYTTTPARRNIIIPAGTRATYDGQTYFLTTDVAVILAGETEVEATAQCTEKGAAHNDLEPGTIKTLVDLIAYVQGVENTTITAGGDDGEPYTVEGDDRYRERIRMAPAKRSTAGPAIAYEYWALTADAGIISAKATSPAPGEVAVYVLMEGGTIPHPETLERVLEVVGSDKVRCMGDRVTTCAPTVVEYDIEFIYYTTKAEESAVVDMVEGAGGAIERYNEWQTGQLGRDINPDYLRRLVLAPSWAEDLPGAIRIDVAQPQHVDVDDTQVPQWSGRLVVSHGIGEGVNG